MTAPKKTGRYYKLTKADGTRRLVRAYNPASAIRHVSRNDWSAEAATADDMAELMMAGVLPENALSVVSEQESLDLDVQPDGGAEE
jgi:hypothetical protein